MTTIPATGWTKTTASSSRSEVMGAIMDMPRWLFGSSCVHDRAVQDHNLGGAPFLDMPNRHDKVNPSSTSDRRWKGHKMKSNHKYPYSTPEQYREWWAENADAPYGSCWCGCNRSAPIATRNEYRFGHVKGQPKRFIHGHNGRLQRRDNCSAWKGGRFIHKSGYVYVKAYTHPFRNAVDYMLEHRLVMEDHLNRYLWPWEIVHHKNGNKADNRIENLEVMDPRRHVSEHFRKRRESDPKNKTIRELRRIGLSFVKIGQLVGLSGGAVRCRLIAMEDDK